MHGDSDSKGGEGNAPNGSRDSDSNAPSRSSSSKSMKADPNNRKSFFKKFDSDYMTPIFGGPPGEQDIEDTDLHDDTGNLLLGPQSTATSRHSSPTNEGLEGKVSSTSTGSMMHSRASDESSMSVGSKQAHRRFNNNHAV
jgi:hypothetical protein